MLSITAKSRQYLIIVFSFFFNQLFAQMDSLTQETQTKAVINTTSVSFFTDTIELRLLNTGNTVQFGANGMGMAARLNGTSILNISSSPLIVVDGIPYINLSTERFDFTTADERDYAALIGLPQDEIKEIALLRDAPSAAQYGSRAANGVIIITTHRGSNKKINVNYSYKSIISAMPKGYNMLNGDDYTMMMKQGIYNAYQNQMSADINEFNYDPSWEYYFNYSQNTDWTEAITRRGIMQEHNLLVSGNINKLGYSLSAGHQAEDGTTIGTGQRSFTTRFLLDYNFSHRLNVSFGVNYKHFSLDSVYQRNGYIPVREIAVKKMANMSIYEMDELGNVLDNYFLPIPNLQGLEYTNPVALANLSKDKRKTSQVFPTLSLSYHPMKQLKYTFNISLMDNTYQRDIYVPRELYGFVIKSTSNNEAQLFYTHNQIVYTPRLNNKHSLATFASFNTYDARNQSDYSRYKYKSRFSILRINYLAYNKYLIDICARGEQSTIKYKSYKYWIDPSASVHWFVSKENFMKSFVFLDNFSFKASYGEYSNLMYSEWFASGLTGKDVQQDLVVNIAMLKNRVNLNLNLYKRTSKDQQVERTYYFYPASDYLWDIENKGWEYSMHTDIIRHKDFSVHLAISLYKNFKTYTKVSNAINTSTKYPFDELSNGEYLRNIELNKPIGVFSGHRNHGVYIDDEDAIATDNNGNRISALDGTPVYMKFLNYYTFKGGDVKYADLNYDGIINESDVVNLGNANPTFSGSGGPTIRYKGWWLGVYFNFRYGNDIVNMARMDLEKMYNFDNQSSVVLNRWRKPGDITDIPRSLIGSGFNWLGSDRFVEDGSFLRLKAITLKYQFQEAIVKKLHLSNLGLFVTCRNLVTFTNYKGVDPDISLYGTWEDLGYDNNYTPETKEFMFGINIEI